MDPIRITKPYLPNKKKYTGYLDKIYTNNWLTNDGPVLQELTGRLENYLGVRNLLLVANGTLALQIAYRLLEIKHVLTTPFTFIATASSLLWDKYELQFSDIDPFTFNMDPEKIPAANIDAVVPVHVFGNPCAVDKIAKLSDQQKIRIIYDAAHAFGVRYNDKSILNYGDISVLSFHATKIFHTIEGGGLIIKDDDLYHKAKAIINFGFSDGNINELGINAKMNEFQAAMGLCVLDDFKIILEKRKFIFNTYREKLADYVQFQKLHDHIQWNYSYTPVVFKSEADLLKVCSLLQENNVFPRRYFFPSLNMLSCLQFKIKMDNSEALSKKILCLPMFFEITEKQITFICELVKQALD